MLQIYFIYISLYFYFVYHNFTDIENIKYKYKIYNLEND